MNTRPIGASFAALAAIIAALLFARDLSTTYAFLAPGTTFTVNSTGDLPDADPEDGLCQTANGNGECTLRAALEQANARAHPDKEADTIAFNIPGSGLHTIRPRSPLPALLGQITIDGYTQPGSAPDSNSLDFANDAHLRIELDGAQAGANANGLTIQGDFKDWDRVYGITIQGLIINRFSGDGIESNYARATRIAGNFIGTDPTGTMDLGNGGSGIAATGSSPWVVGNILSGNEGFGLYEDYAGESLTGSNLIGTNAGGNQPLGNRLGGAVLRWGKDFILHQNLISGNSGPGLQVVEGNELYMQGNLIGTQADGEAPLGNKGSGVVFAEGFQLVSFGSIGNTVAYNGGDGLEVLGSALQMRGHNSIHSNSGLGIDLAGDGVTPNDRLDQDTGPNFLQNFPQIASARVTTSGLTIRGRLLSGVTPPYPYYHYAISFYASPECDPSGYGEGKTYLGGVEVITDDRGRAQFETTLPVTVPARTFITATATANLWEDGTSEFSRCQRVTGPRR